MWIVEWHRPDRRRALYRVCGLAALLVALGASFAGLARIAESGSNLGIGYAVAAALCILGGPLLALIGIPRSMGGEAYLALRNDGVVWQSPEKSHFVAWSALERIDVNADGHLTLVGDPVPLYIPERFDGASPAALVKSMERLKQRALMGLLKPPVEQKGPVRTR